MSNDVKIVIRADVQTKPGFDKADREATLAGDKAGSSYLAAFAKRMEKLGTMLSAQVQQTGRQVGQDMGGKVGEQVEQKVTESVKRSRTKAKPASTETGRGLGADIGDALTEPIATKMRGALYVSAARSRGAARESGAEIGSEMGESAGRRISERIRSALRGRFRGNATVDVDTKKGSAESLGDAGKSLGDGILGGLSLGTIGKVILAAIVPVLAPGLAGVISAGLLTALGGGVLAIGIAGAFKDPRIKAAGKEFQEMLGFGKKVKGHDPIPGLLGAFGEPFRSPVADFLEKMTRFLDKLIPKARELGQEFAPILGEIGTGLIGLLQNAGPGIHKALEASKPIIETLAKHLPQIGDAISRFFSVISDQSDDANLAWGDMLTAIERIIVTIGILISWLTSAYSTVRRITKNGVAAFNALGDSVSQFGRDAASAMLRFALFVLDRVYAPLLIAAAEAFGWIPGIGPKLRAAQNAFTNFRSKVNNELNKIHDKTVTIKIRQVFTTVGHAVTDAAAMIASQMANGGVKGAATGAISGGWTWVGERGPELAKLPPGTSVRTAGDSARMASGERGAGLFVRLESSGNSVLDELFRWLLERSRIEVRERHGGNAQAAFGRAS